MKEERTIAVTGCFIDCPYEKEHSGRGHCAGFHTCQKNKMLLRDQDNYDVGEWERKGKKIHPDCPLETIKK